MAMSMRIVADSGCDMNEDLKNNMEVSLVPLTLKIEGHEYRDDDRLDRKEFLNRMKESETNPQTSCPSPADFMEAYGEGDNVFVVTLSSQLSGTYSSALLAKEMFIEKHGHKFIHVFDSLSAAVGETLVCIKIHEMIKENWHPHEIIERVNSYIHEMKTYFVLESLENLIKAGRMSKIAGTIASTFSIKPVMRASDKGTIELVEKARGTKKALSRLIEIIGEQGERFDEKILGISHCNCLAKAEALRDEIKKRYNFKDIIIVEAGGLVSVYANQDGIVIAF
jgi:DegV family protein with EDD domain